ncbi:FAD-binding oxidoreductase [Candidatus Woesearchaeota archaeon]|nr:FAD-binding oxidoreductase [Candidatus Woesearchaeota archaeon]
MKSYDVLIVGAGILGLSTAYHLQRENPSMAIAVIDKGTPGSGNTSRSVTMLRDTFASDVSIALAGSSIGFYKGLQEGGTDIGPENMMYLWLFNDSQYAKNRSALEVMHAKGIQIEEIAADELQRKVPSLCLDPTRISDDAATMGLPPITCGILGKNCYSVDPLRIVDYYRSAFIKLGGEVYSNVFMEDFLVVSY